MKNDDLRWLYRDEDDADETRVLSSEQPQPPGGGYPEPHAEQYASRQQWAGQPSAGQQYQAPPMDPPAGKRRRRRKRRPIRKFLLTVVLSWLVFMIGTPIYAWTTVEVVEGSGSTLPDQRGTAVLLVGTDGDGSAGQRTDTMMLLYRPPSGKSVLLGFPRDSYVEIPGRGSNKLNAAYAFGGPDLLLETLEHNTGIQIDGYLEIGMTGLVDLVDAVGGVEVCPEAPMKDRDAHLDIPAGCQTLDGETALGYVRMRKSDPKGDLGRMERQREVIGKIVRGAASPSTLLNPVSYWELNHAAAGTLRRTEDTGIPTMAGAGIGLVSTFTGAGISMTVPVSSTNTNTSAGSSVIWDEEASQAVFAAIAAGDTSELDKYHK